MSTKPSRAIDEKTPKLPPPPETAAPPTGTHLSPPKVSPPSPGKSEIAKTPVTSLTAPAKQAAKPAVQAVKAAAPKKSSIYFPPSHHSDYVKSDQLPLRWSRWYVCHYLRIPFIHYPA